MSTRNPISDGVACSKIAQYQSNVHTAAGYTSASSIYTPKGSFTYDSESQTKANHWHTHAHRKVTQNYSDKFAFGKHTKFVEICIPFIKWNN